MLDAENAGGASDDTGSADQTQEHHADNQETEKPIAKEDHQRALTDLKKYKSRWRETQSQLSDLQKEIETLKTAKLQGDNDYKTLYEGLKGKYDEQVNKNSQLKESLLYNEKFRAVFPELKKAGLRDDAQNLLEMQDLRDLEVEATSSGRFLVQDVQGWVDGFKQKYPYAFQPKKAPGVNSTGGQSQIDDTGKLTPQALFELERECKKKGDMAPYHAAYKRYLESKRHGR